MEAPRKGRTMFPRPQQGESVLLALRLSVTDEGLYFARLAHKAPGHDGLVIRYSTKKMWDDDGGGTPLFAADVASDLSDAMEWIVS